MLSHFKIVILIITFSTATAAQGVYHVVPPPLGSDANPGTESQPWATIAKANQDLQAGDTVLVHAGTYTEVIRPVANNASPLLQESDRITYRAVGAVILDFQPLSGPTGPAVGTIALGAKSYVTVDGFKLLPGSTVQTAVFGTLAGSDHCIIQNCHMEGAADRGIVMASYLAEQNSTTVVESSYNILRRNYMRGSLNYPSAYTEDLVVLGCNSHHNLIEDNVLEEAIHVTLNVFPGDLSRPHHNVIRRNVIRNTHHTALSMYRVDDHNVVEGNRCEGSYTNLASPGNAFQCSMSSAIIRHNVITKGGDLTSSIGGLIISSSRLGNGVPIASFDNHVYNNTIVKNRGPAIGGFLWDNGNVTGLGVGRNVFVNNILYDAEPGRRPIHYSNASATPGGVSDVWRTNLVGNPRLDGTPTPHPSEYALEIDGQSFLVLQAETLTAPAPTFQDTLQVAPQFIDFVADDYRLRSTSPLIDRGSALTEVAMSDPESGRIVHVADAAFFQDGRGMMDLGVFGDEIAIGHPSRVARVTRVDETNDTLTLDRDISRAIGDPVWLTRLSDRRRILHGSAPDIGALETRNEQSIFEATTMPDRVDPQRGPVELGQRFVVSRAGRITALRYWRAAGDTDNHQGHLWAEDGTLLATVTFEDATTGWQSAGLVPPVDVDAGSTYTVSVNADTAIPRLTRRPTVSSPHITARLEGLVAPIGQFPKMPKLGPAPFLRDVVFVPATPAELQNGETLFTDQVPTINSQNDDVQYELGMKFRVSRDGSVVALRYWRSHNDPGPHSGRLWAADGSLLAQVTFADETEAGWQEATLDPAVAIVAGLTYVVSADITQIFPRTSQGLSQPTTNGHIESIADGNNGVYGAPGQFPNASFDASNYFRDIRFIPNP